MGNIPSTRAICRHRSRLPLPSPFDLRTALFGHGWVDLPPHSWDERQARWTTVLLLGEIAVDAEVRQGEKHLLIGLEAFQPLDRSMQAQARNALRHMLRLDEDLRPFWKRCAATPNLSWVPRRGGGRLLRSQTVFEDLFKILCTTNCSWAATRNMVERLVQAAGVPAPSGRRAFPPAAVLSRRREAFFRTTVRAGYRAGSARALIAACHRDGLEEELLAPGRSTADLRARLLGLSGFGPYAAGQALRLLGHYRDLALDSWCRNRLAAVLGRKRPPSDSAVERAYRSFGPWSGLALWMDLTARWHGEEAAEMT